MSSVANLLNELDDMIDQAWSLPLTAGKALVDAEVFKQVIDDIRVALPNEIQQAKAIVNDRQTILSEARKEAADIVRRAKDKAEILVSREEVVREAEKKSKAVIASTQKETLRIKNATNDYVEEIMKKTEIALATNLNEFKRKHQNLSSSIRKSLKG